MARTLVSANLNTYGNAGQFETDRSTWGFSDGAVDATVTRSTDQKTAGLYGAKVVKAGLSSTLFVPCQFALTLGKTYLIKAKVYVPAVNPIGPNDMVITLTSSLDNLLFGLTEIDHVDKTALEATGVWQDVEIAVECTSVPFPNTEVALHYGASGSSASLNGIMHVDQFEVYEFVETDDPEPTCTIDLDEASTVVTDESAPAAADGSISGAVTGGTGPFEWSLNGGAWQASNLFAGLTAGNYTLSVREQANPDCNDSYVFAVNSGAIAFDFTIEITDETIAGASDGSAVLTPSGSGGPYTYSKDGGETFQAGNSFTDLPPGDYAFVVKDSAGNTLVKYATVEAGEILFERAFFSKNPIPFSVNAESGHEAMTNYRIYCDTRVEEEAGSGVFTSKLAQELPANSDGQAVFNLRPAFRNEVVAIVPDEPTSSITKLTDRLKWYKNYYGHLENEEVTPAALTATNPFIVLLGGVSKYHFPTINYLTTYLQTNKKFLTWAPVVKDISRQQEDYLNFFVYAATISQIKFQTKVYFDDDTNETAVSDAVDCLYGELYQIPAGTSNTSVLTINPAKNPIRYELSLLNQSDSLISEVRTYNIDRVTHPRVRYLMMLNSLGAWEVHRFIGQTRTEEQFTREVMQKFLPHDHGALDGDYETNDVQGQRSYSFSSGHFKGKYAEDWHEYMRDLLRSTRVYDVTSGERMPLLITSTSMPLKQDQNYRRFVRVDAREVYSNENYTPDEV